MVLRALRRTRQVRSFTDEPVAEADIQSLLEICRWTGSSMNTQPWQFIVIRDAEVRRRIGEISVHARHVGKAPLAIAISMPDVDRETDAYDEGRVAERILIAAGAMDPRGWHRLGRGAALAGGRDAARRDSTGVRADDHVDRPSDRGGPTPEDRPRHGSPSARGVRPGAVIGRQETPRPKPGRSLQRV